MTDSRRTDLTALEIAEALVQSMPERIQQSGGDPIKIDMVDIDFDPDTEAATADPTSFWIRTESGQIFNLLVSDGRDCRELHCRSAAKQHRYGSDLCDWRLVDGEVLPKD